MKTNKISNLSKYLLLGGGLALVLSLFMPIWSISLDAPQYPEGLALQIWANKIAGDVDIINGLNHYIGMKTLHTDDFIEFTVLPYVIGFYAILFFITALKGNQKMINILFIAFLLFGVVAMVDFWKWEYDYGHNLNPHAAIIVPGMAYQPPLIGFKQLLNFGAFSIPAAGGWLFIGAGLAVLAAVVLETKKPKQGLTNHTKVVAIIFALFFMASCSPNGPEPIAFNKDACDFCKMSISEASFAAQLITSKGRVYKFDDINCMRNYAKSNPEVVVKNYYVAATGSNNTLVDATGAWFVKSDEIKSPMGGNTLAFQQQEQANNYARQSKGSLMAWDDVKPASTN
jgi:copper chaperone NosL